MEIGLYIAELLGEQDEVSVTGLGTFSKERIAGKFDNQSNLFYPPSYNLSFRKNTNSFSGLSEYISLKRSLSISSSEELIKKFTETILDILNSSDAVEINHLGSLHKENEQLAFKPSDSFGIVDKFYGLKPIPEHKIAIIPVSNQEILTDYRENPSPVEENELEEEIYIDAPKARLVPILIISILAISASLFALFYFNQSFNQLIRNIISSKFTTSVPVEPVKTVIPVASDSLTTKLTVTDSIAKPIENNQETAQKEITNKPVAVLLEEKVPATNEGISYEIIVAAFARKKDAESYITEMNSKGYKAKIVENLPGKMMKISLGSFTEEESANTELKQIQKDINKDAWIARVKPLKNP
jgi:cell division septation protein DedD/nucleoid DNA-binding protein